MNSFNSLISKSLLAFFLLFPSVFFFYGGLYAKAPADNHQKILREGSKEERRETLAWLAENGGKEMVGAIVPRLKDKDDIVRYLAEKALWSIWGRSGDTQLDELLKFGTASLLHGSPATAKEIFSQIISKKPDFAESYNKRATAFYMMGDYEHALRDIQKALQRNPYHFGAFSGAGFCMIQLKRLDEALFFFNRALQINPNLQGLVELRGNIEKMLQKQTI